MHNPDDKPSNCFILLTFSNVFNFLAIHVSHGCNTIGGIEYGGCGEDKKKDIVSHQLGVSTGLWRCPSIDINVSE